MFAYLYSVGENYLCIINSDNVVLKYIFEFKRFNV